MTTSQTAPPPTRVRDATATRCRILEAATVEFAAAGLAGGRIARIPQRARGRRPVPALLHAELARLAGPVAAPR